MNTPKSSEDAAKYIIKILLPGTPFPLQSPASQKVIEYMKLRDESLLTSHSEAIRERVNDLRKKHGDPLYQKALDDILALLNDSDV